MAVMKIKQDCHTSNNTTSPRSDFAKINEVEPSRSPMSDSRDANTTKEPIKGSLNKKKLNLVQINRIRNTGKIVKRKRKPFKIKWKVKFMSRSPMSDSRVANTTIEPIKGSLIKKKLNLIRINRIRNTGKIVK